MPKKTVAEPEPAILDPDEAKARRRSHYQDAAVRERIGHVYDRVRQSLGHPLDEDDLWSPLSLVVGFIAADQQRTSDLFSFLAEMESEEAS